MTLSALALNCTLRPGKEESSTDKLLQELLRALGKHDVESKIVHVADLNIKPGVISDEGPGDDWPALSKRVLVADILIIGTPIWLGRPSSVAKRVLERMDAFLEVTDRKKRMPSFGKVGIVAVVAMRTRALLSCRDLSSPQRCWFHDPGLRGALTGWERQRDRPTTRICASQIRRRRKRRSCWRPMPRILPPVSKRGAIPVSNA